MGLSPPKSEKESNNSMLFLGKLSTVAVAERSLSSTDSVCNDDIVVSILGSCFGLTESAILDVCIPYVSARSGWSEEERVELGG